MELRELANNEASAFIERLVAAAEARATKARLDAEEQVATMRTEVDALRTELETESTRAASLEADLDSVIEAHRQVDGERLEAETKRTQEAAARGRVEDELRGVRELLERARAEATRVAEALEDEAAEKALVQEELEGVRLALAGLERSYEAAEKTIGTLEGRLAELEELESALRAEVSEAAARATAFQAETAAAAQTMRDRYDAEIRAARGEVDAVVNERDAARGDLEMIRTEAEMLRGDLASMRETAEVERAKAVALEAEGNAVRADAETTRALAEEFQRDAETFKMEAAAARVDTESLKADLQAARSGAEALGTEAESFKAREEMLRAEIELSRDEAQMLRSEVEKLRADAVTRAHDTSASDELKTLQEMLDASREHHERQVAAARELEARLQASEGRLQNVEAATTSTLAVSVRAIEALANVTTISDLFGTIVNQLATELPRVALFRVKGNHLEGEQGAGFEDSISIKKIVIPMNVDSVITRAALGGTIVRAEGADLAAARPPFGGAPVSAFAVPIMFQGEPLAVLYVDSDAPTTNAHATLALLVIRHAMVLLSRLTQELKVLKELREYAMLLLQEAEQMFVADVDGGRPAHESIRRLRDTVDCGRQLYAQRAALEGTEAAGLFDEHVSIMINARASAFAEALEAATAEKTDQKRAAS